MFDLDTMTDEQIADWLLEWESKSDKYWRIVGKLRKTGELKSGDVDYLLGIGAINKERARALASRTVKSIRLQVAELRRDLARDGAALAGIAPMSLQDEVDGLRRALRRDRAAMTSPGDRAQARVHVSLAASGLQPGGMFNQFPVSERAKRMAQAIDDQAAAIEASRPRRSVWARAVMA